VAGVDLFSGHRPLAIFNLIGYGAQILSFLFGVDSPLYYGEQVLMSQVKIKKRLPALLRVLPVMSSMISIVGIKDSGSKSVDDFVTSILVRS
jgi:hypothetical protein